MVETQLCIIKRHLCDRGFRPNPSLQAAWDTSIARTTGFMWPHQRCSHEGNKIWQLWNSVSVKVCGYEYVCELLYIYIYILVGRNNINSSMGRGNKGWCITLWIGQTITRSRTQIWVVIGGSGEWSRCNSILGNNQKRVYPVRLESKTGTAWNQVKNTLDEPRDWPKTNRTRFSEIITRVHL